MLGIMTSNMLLAGGVIGDFHGDAAMGFWGWPLDQDDAEERACNTTVAIKRHLEEIGRDKDHPLRDFRVGMGIATGRAVAGMIGTSDQVKVTAFGPVVNLAARLESLTKLMKASVLIDGTTAKKINEQDDTRLKLRRLAIMQPVGIRRDIEVHQLLSAEQRKQSFSSSQLDNYAEALQDFINGDWSRASRLLAELPETDQAKDFLANYISQRNAEPPEDWNGVIKMSIK